MTNLTNNASTIDVTPPVGDPTQLSSYKTLTVADSCTGSGGEIGLNTFLGSDGSPSDRLVVNGMASGMTSLTIHNTTAPGSETTGNGIRP